MGLIEYYVSQAECRVIGGRDDVILTAVLGSCVAACVWDAEVGVGGMNHFLLPRSNGGGRLAAMRTGSAAMPALIEQCLAAGARRERLQARLFGGAHVLPRLGDIGARNVVFARDFLRGEGIAVLSEQAGGSQARRVRFWPSTGAARQRLIAGGAG